MKYTFVWLCVFSMMFGVAHTVQAVTPTVSLSQTSATTGTIYIYGDPSATVRLNYGPSAGQSTVVGTTDQSGNLSLPISLSGYLVQCGNRAYVTINSQQSPTIAWSINPATCTSNSSAAISFSQDNVVLNVGQSQNVVLYGASPYSVVNNTNTSVISTGINGNVLTLSAIAFGGATIRVCGNDNQCDTIDVVAVNNGPQQTQTYTQPLGLASFLVASNNTNGKFVNTGNTLTLTFNGNRPLTNVVLRVNGSQLGVSGGGAGPYTASYTVTGSEGSLFPVVVTFSDTSGTSGQATFALGNAGSSAAPSVPVQTPIQTPAPVVTPPVSTPAPTSVPSTPAATYTFTKFLELEDTGAEVTQLQKRLTALGFYNGPITGTFGPLTEAAVKKLQKANGITQAGYVGPGTRAVLNK